MAIVEQQFKLADKIVLEGILRCALHGVARVKADAIDPDRTAQIQYDKGTQCAKNPLAREGIFSPARRDQFQQGRLQVGGCHILDRWCGDPPTPPQGPLSHVLSPGHVVRAESHRQYHRVGACWQLQPLLDRVPGDQLAPCRL